MQGSLLKKWDLGSPVLHFEFTSDEQEILVSCIVSKKSKMVSQCFKFHLKSQVQQPLFKIDNTKCLVDVSANGKFVVMAAGKRFYVYNMETGERERYLAIFG